MAVKSIQTIATLPAPTFLENIAIRSDHSFLLTSHVNNTLYYLSPGSQDPKVLHTFDHHCLGIVETSPDIFHISVSSEEAPGSSSIWRLNMNSYSPTEPLSISKALDVPTAKWLNGSCALSPTLLLLADSKAGLIWRADLDKLEVSVWLQHESMADDPTSEWAVAPGINGVRESAGYVYWTNTVRAGFSRVRVDEALGPVGEVETVAVVPVGDDFIVDERRKGAYVMTHALNTIQWVSFDGKENVAVAGEPVNEALLGPTAAAWSRREEDMGKVFYVTTEGGIVMPLEGRIRDARLLRIELE